MTSGGTTPSTRSITKKGDPTTEASVSSHGAAGTGAEVSAATRRMMWNCLSKS